MMTCPISRIRALHRCTAVSRKRSLPLRSTIRCDTAIVRKPCATLQSATCSPTRRYCSEPDHQASNRRSILEEHYGSKDKIYPHFKPGSSSHGAVTRIRDEFSSLGAGERAENRIVEVCGRLKSRRDAGKNLVFLDIEGNGEGIIQIVGSMRQFEDKADYLTQTAKLRHGDIVEVFGIPGKTKVGELSVFANSIRLLSPSMHDIPPVLEDVQIKSRQRHLNMLVNPQQREILKTRSKLVQSIRSYFCNLGFVEVETPILWSQAGGATARPFLTRAHALDRDLAMRIATELHLKTLVVGGLNRVFEVGKQFRNEGIDSTHNPEFTTCEAYMAYAAFDDLLDMTEDMLRTVLHTTIGKHIVKVKRNSEELEIDFEKPFARLEVTAALEDAVGPLPDLKSESAISDLLKLCSDAGIVAKKPYTIPALLDKLIGVHVEPLCIQPTFLYRHPLAMSPLAKATPDNPELAQRFEIFVNGSELCNAYQELNDPDEQRDRFRQQQELRDLGDDEAPIPDEDYCHALEYGLPPTVGLGFGIDRLTMLACGSSHIRDVIAFPLNRSLDRSDDKL